MIGGCDPADLAERFGTPLYVYDLAVIDRQVDALRAVLPERGELAYAVKANPALAVVSRLVRLGLGADVASAGELATATRAGIDPERLVMTGPGKRDDELAAAVRLGIRAVTVESIGELARLESIAAEAGRRQPVLLRATASATDASPVERTRIIGDAGAGKFGMDRADLLAAADLAAASPHLELLGVHAFGASNILDAAALVEHIAAVGRLAAVVGRRTGRPIGVVDAGGGLGIPYGPDDRALDLAALGAGLHEVLGTWAVEPALREARLLLEPGRFLVGQAGTYLARVVDVKTVDGRLVAVLDGGMHHVLRPVLVREEHRLRLLTPSDEPPTRVAIAGPLCSGLDLLAEAAVLPRPVVGDLVGVLDVGAYGFTESMPFFLSHPIPAEVVVLDGDAALIRPRQDPVTWLDAQSVPDLAVARAAVPV